LGLVAARTTASLMSSAVRCAGPAVAEQRGWPEFGGEGLALDTPLILFARRQPHSFGRSKSLSRTSAAYRPPHMTGSGLAGSAEGAGAAAGRVSAIRWGCAGRNTAARMAPAAATPPATRAPTVRPRRNALVDASCSA